MTLTEQLETIKRDCRSAIAAAEKATAGPMQVVEGNTPLGETGDFEGYAQIECVGYRQSDPVVVEIWNPEDGEVELLKFFALSRTICPKAARATLTAIEALESQTCPHCDGSGMINHGGSGEGEEDLEECSERCQGRFAPISDALARIASDWFSK